MDVRKESLTRQLPGGLKPHERLVTSALLARLLGGSADSFTGKLLELYTSADPGNRDRLRTAFPSEIIAMQIWMVIDPAPTAGQMADILRMIDELRA